MSHQLLSPEAITRSASFSAYDAILLNVALDIGHVVLCFRAMTPADTSDNEDVRYLAAAVLANAVDVFDANQDIDAAKYALLEGRRAAKLQSETPDELHLESLDQ